MGEPATAEPGRPSTASQSSSPSNHPPSSSSLVEPSATKRKGRPEKVLRVMRSVFRSFPIITHPVCKFPSIPYAVGRFPDGPVRGGGGGGTRVTGTLFGYRKGRASLSVQENPGTLPTLVLEMAMQTHALQREMGQGMVRITMECEKAATAAATARVKLLEEPVWTMFCNGRKIGYGKRREATEEDLGVMEALKVVSMGAGVLPGKSDVDGPDGEIAYVRAHFDRTVGSKDSETLYMISPDANSGPELSIFFVRL
ncbi:unnamed protein product [Cuscuta campestris]|uniref:Protein MIZU-KUSSEI 1 n=1 Tax=Cuscuta campestris TaxID=132261 RepID=A0A484L1K4_9ASTE|nr:unnamed protein product [Cuscuta campestris]